MRRQRGATVHVVDRSGVLGALTSVHRALLLANAGDVIAVCPGTYVEPPLVVDRDVEICGVRMMDNNHDNNNNHNTVSSSDSPSSSSSSSAVTICAEPTKCSGGETDSFTICVPARCSLTLRGVLVRNTNTDSTCVLAKGQGASVTIDGCVVTAGSGTGAACEGSSVLTLRRSLVADNAWGVVALDRSHVTIEKCELLRNKHDALACSGRATCHAQGNAVRDNFRHGFFFFGAAGGTCERNRFEGNKGCAVLLDHGTDVAMVGNVMVGKGSTAVTRSANGTCQTLTSV
eukprot:PhM_4_TR7177/c0_g1_i1/m.74380